MYKLHFSSDNGLHKMKKKNKKAAKSDLLWRQPDSNRRPFDCEPNALPTELCPRTQQFILLHFCKEFNKF